MSRQYPNPDDCPDAAYHGRPHRYCPCGWIEPDPMAEHKAGPVPSTDRIFVPTCRTCNGRLKLHHDGTELSYRHE